VKGREAQKVKKKRFFEKKRQKTFMNLCRAGKTADIPD
jgi:hypothetical protein